MRKLRGLAGPAIAVAAICAIINTVALFVTVLLGGELSLWLWSSTFFPTLLVFALLFFGLSVGGTYAAAYHGAPLSVPTILLSVLSAAWITAPYWLAGKPEPIKTDAEGMPVCAQAGGIEFECHDPGGWMIWGGLLIAFCSLVALSIFGAYTADRRDERST